MNGSQLKVCGEEGGGKGQGGVVTGVTVECGQRVGQLLVRLSQPALMDEHVNRKHPQPPPSVRSKALQHTDKFCPRRKEGRRRG